MEYGLALLEKLVKEGSRIGTKIIADSKTDRYLIEIPSSDTRFLFKIIQRYFAYKNIDEYQIISRLVATKKEDERETTSVKVVWIKCNKEKTLEKKMWTQIKDSLMPDDVDGLNEDTGFFRLLKDAPETPDEFGDDEINFEDVFEIREIKK